MRLIDQMLQSHRERYPEDDAEVVTAMTDEAQFRAILERIHTAKPIGTTVEIGTNRGFSTMLLREFSRVVHSFDATDWPGRREIFDVFGLPFTHFHLIRDDAEKAEILAGLDFDFAFVDGNHRAPEIDFDLAKRCGRVLFHDYSPGFPPDNCRTCVVNYVDSLDGIAWKEPPFAYWTEGGCDV